jgi:uncharacterized protein (UPF0335 family)
MAVRGPRPEYNQPKLLRAAVEQYFEDCAEENVFPDFAGMKQALQLRDSDIERLTEEKNPRAQDYRDIFDEARDRRESWLVRKMASDPKMANGCMNALKQEKNGGYMDRAGNGGEVTLKIKTEGVGGMHAFD